MPLRRCRYLHLDVFTDRRFGGNQLAVFPDAADLSIESMQAIAREMNFAESTFVTAPESSDSDVRMRIFTPFVEMPMAGHPVIGSAFALARERRIAANRTSWVFGLNIGPLQVELEWRDSQLAFAWMTQRTPEFSEPLADAGPVAQALGIEEGAIVDAGLPVQHVSCGVPFLIVPVKTRAALDGADPDSRLLEDEVYAFTTDRTGAEDNADVYTRMFAPQLGIYEDPATGSAAGPLGCYLLRHRRWSPGKPMLNLQGQKLGRPSWLHIVVDSAADHITRVRVGGTSVFVAEGTFEL